jgi:hypothetical protein
LAADGHGVIVKMEWLADLSWTATARRGGPMAMLGGLAFIGGLAGRSCRLWRAKCE